MCNKQISPCCCWSYFYYSRLLLPVRNNNNMVFVKNLHISDTSTSNNNSSLLQLLLMVRRPSSSTLLLMKMMGTSSKWRNGWKGKIRRNQQQQQQQPISYSTTTTSKFEEEEAKPHHHHCQGQQQLTSNNSNSSITPATTMASTATSNSNDHHQQMHSSNDDDQMKPQENGKPHQPQQNGKQQQNKMINLTSDNWTGAHANISEALMLHSAGGAKAYGESDLDKKIEHKFAEIFEREVAVYFVGTGTAANALAMAYVNRPGGIIFAHKHAHLIEDECGAPEYFTGGARIFGVGGPHGKMDLEELDDAIKRYPVNPDYVHAGQRMAVSITQSTESGTVYSVRQIEQIAKLAHAHGIPLHMDGARFANALCALGCTAAEMTWKSGVDILSFGATKNGCWCAEAIVVFNDVQKAERNFPYLRKRSAHLFSKTRFIAAQLDAYFHDDLWLFNARHANKMASRLADVIRASDNSIQLAWEVEANEVFVVMQRRVAELLKETGRISPFYEWPVPYEERHALDLNPQAEGLYRLVTTFATRAEEVDEFGQLLARFC